MSKLTNPVVERLFGALNGRDLDTVSLCFGPDFTSEWPTHPGRNFDGPEKVRQNWEMIFKMSPELRIEVTDAAEVGDDVWCECHYTEAAGQDLKGIIIVTVRDGLIRHSRFFMEPIDTADAPVPGGPRLAQD
jgi:ketosteroid isomerase-like protein